VNRARRPSLRLIKGSRGEDPPGWGGSVSPDGAEPVAPLVDEPVTALVEEPSSPFAAVCGHYGIGLLLETRLDAFPHRDDAFLVVDSELNVQNVSGQAAALLGVRTEDAIDRPVSELLAPADAEAGEPEDFLRLVRGASTHSDRRHSVIVRPRNSFGVRMVARIAPCGPPRAAVVLLRNRLSPVDLELQVG
jgi:PAS domain-containing protein